MVCLTGNYLFWDGDGSGSKLVLVRWWTSYPEFGSGFPFVDLLFINSGLLYHAAHRTSVADACMRLASGHALDEMRFAMGSRSPLSITNTYSPSIWSSGVVAVKSPRRQHSNNDHCL